MALLAYSGPATILRISNGVYEVDVKEVFSASNVVGGIDDDAGAAQAPDIEASEAAPVPLHRAPEQSQAPNVPSELSKDSRNLKLNTTAA